MKNTQIYAHMLAAHGYANMSHCKRQKVGAIIVKNNAVISIGYNGTYPGELNTCEDGNNKTKSDVIHAEINALAKIWHSTETTVGACIFITHSPCFNCANMISLSGITDVYYNEVYKNDLCTDGIRLLESRNINTHFTHCKIPLLT